MRTSIHYIRITRFRCNFVAIPTTQLQLHSTRSLGFIAHGLPPLVGLWLALVLRSPLGLFSSCCQLGFRRRFFFLLLVELLGPCRASSFGWRLHVFVAQWGCVVLLLVDGYLSILVMDLVCHLPGLKQCPRPSQRSQISLWIWTPYSHNRTSIGIFTIMCVGFICTRDPRRLRSS